MFTPSLCREVGDMPEWGYGAFNKAHQTIKYSKCHCKGKGKFHTFKSRWAPDKKKYEKIYISPSIIRFPI
jgi:hypothetical protein